MTDDLIVTRPLDIAILMNEARDRAAWDGYDAAAAWRARHRIVDRQDRRLPVGLAVATLRLIAEDWSAFCEHVRGHAYALAMTKDGG